MDQRRFAKKAQTKFPTHGLVGRSLLRRFCKAFGLGHSDLPMPWIFFYFFSLCLGYAFLKEELVEDEALSLFFCCICATVVYPPNPPRALECMKGNPDEFICITFDGRIERNRWEGDPWVASTFQIHQDRDKKGTSFL